jgi:hypothetical protein
LGCRVVTKGWDNLAGGGGAEGKGGSVENQRSNLSTGRRSSYVKSTTYGPFGYHSARTEVLANRYARRQRSRECERLLRWAAGDLGFRCLPMLDQLHWFQTLARWAAGMVAAPPVADSSRLVSLVSPVEGRA